MALPHIPTQTFTGKHGDTMEGTKTVDQLKADTLEDKAMFNPSATHVNGDPGGIHKGNLATNSGIITEDNVNSAVDGRLSGLAIVQSTDTNIFESNRTTVKEATHSTKSDGVILLPGIFRNLVITTNSNTDISITADFLVVTDSNNITKLLTNVSLTVVSTATGENGLDTGSLDASTEYFLWVAHKAATNTTAGFLSKSSTSPSLPAGYDLKTRLPGSQRTDGTENKNLLRAIQNGNKGQYIVGTNPVNYPLITSGAVAGWTAFSIDSFIPLTAKIIDVIAYGNVSSYGRFAVAPNNSFSKSTADFSNPPPLFYENDAGSGSNSLKRIKMILESRNIYWFAAGNGSATAGVRCVGWEE